jgi:hypothetical protein
MAASTQTSGVGTRYAVVFLLDTDGLPYQDVSSAAPETGYRIDKIKTFSSADPEVQRFTHYGDDTPFAQDSLAPTEVETFTITTAKVNLDLDAALSGTKVAALGNEVARLAANTNKLGSEPQVMIFTYRQALDTNPSSASYGARRYEGRVYPKSRLVPKTPPYEAGITDKTYEGTPTPVRKTEYGQTLTTGTHGCTEATHFDDIYVYAPRINIWRGNGTLTAFSLSHTPVSSSYLKVWVNGALTTPSSVDLSAANPAFTLAAPPANNHQVYALIQTATPEQAEN